MATGIFPATGGFTGVSDLTAFIPELWSDEVRGAYEQNLVLANLVKRVPFEGRKGDTMRFPAPVRGAVTAKSENTAVTVQNDTANTQITLTINQHNEYSRLMEDIGAIQALDSQRQFYTQDAGYALAKEIDTDLFALGKNLGDGAGSDWTNSRVKYVDASTGLTAYAADTVASADVVDDDGVRSAIKLLDDSDVPMDDRFWVFPPSVRKDLMGIDRYVSSDFVPGTTVYNGRLGNIYGMELYVSNNCPVVETASANTANANDVKASMMFHRDAFILAEQQTVRSQAQYKQEWLGWLYTADCLYGVVCYRPDNGVVIVVNA